MRKKELHCINIGNYVYKTYYYGNSALSLINFLMGKFMGIIQI